MMGTTLGHQINTDLVRSFQYIVNGGWANLSDGSVEAPQGFFAIIRIEPNELAELTAAFAEEFGLYDLPAPMPGSYLYREDSDGNRSITEYLTLDRAMAEYNELQSEFVTWSAPPEVKHFDGTATHQFSTGPCSCGGNFNAFGKCTSCGKVD